MDSLLTARWLDDVPATAVYDEATVTVAREEARRSARERGFSVADAGSIAIIVSELGHNHLRHARDGRIAVREIVRGEVLGLEIIAADRGDGIEHPTQAIEGAPSRLGGLGIGLSGALRLADEIDFDVRLGAGTCIRARKFVRRAPRRREIGMISRPCIGEVTSGDDALVRRTERGLIVAVADGLGHGAEAREASWRAVELVSENEALDRETLFDRIDRELAGTRGAVLAVIDVDEVQGTLKHATVGNIVTHVASRSHARSFTGGAMVLGARRATKRLHVVEERTELAPGEMFVVTSDGLRSATRVDTTQFGRHPIILAEELMKEFARDGDDVTIVVAS